MPFRTLAVNATRNPTLYFKRVYIKQLDGFVLPTGETHNGICVVGDAGGMNQQHFDLCVGRRAQHTKLPSAAKRGHTMCDIQILDESSAAKPSRRKKR